MSLGCPMFGLPLPDARRVGGFELCDSTPQLGRFPLMFGVVCLARRQTRFKVADASLKRDGPLLGVPMFAVEVCRSCPEGSCLLLGLSVLGLPGARGCQRRAEFCDTALKGGAACVRACPTGAALRVSPEKFLTYTEMDA